MESRLLMFSSAMLSYTLALILCGVATNSIASDEADEYRYCHQEKLSMDKAGDQFEADKAFCDRDASSLDLEGSMYSNTRNMLATSNEYSRQYFVQQEFEQRQKYNNHVASHNASCRELKSDARRLDARQDRYNTRCARSFSLTDDEEQSECGNSDDAFCKQ